MKKDLRVQKTLKSIDDAIIFLLKEKPFKDITIKDICNEAMINRGTFYSHYKDKYELIEVYQESLVSDVEKLLYSNIVGESFSEVKDEQVDIALINLFNYIKENRGRILVVALSVGRVEFTEYFSQHIFEFYRTKQKEFGVLFETEEFSNYLITYISNAHMGIIYKWLKNGCEESVEDMAQLIERFTLEGVFKSVGL